MTQISTQAGSSSIFLTIIFDSHVIKVVNASSVAEWNTSGQTVQGFFQNNTLKVNLQSGYILDSVILTTSNETQALAISADGLSFNLPSFDQAGDYTITITTKKIVILKNINARITLKHDTEAHWILATHFIPKAGEFILYDPDSTYDFTRVKVGDGSTTVTNLPFLFEKLIELENNLGSYLAFLVKGE